MCRSPVRAAAKGCSTGSSRCCSPVLQNWTIRRFPTAAFAEIAGEVPAATISREGLDGAGMPLVELLVHSKLCPSKGQARKDIEGGGVNINNQRITDAARAVTGADLLFEKHVLLRKGKKNYVLVTVQ